MFFSTRDKNLRLTASEAILQGLSFDGGLFLPEQIYPLSVDESFLSLSYQELAYKVLRPYLDDYTDEEVKEGTIKHTSLLLRDSINESRSSTSKESINESRLPCLGIIKTIL